MKPRSAPVVRGQAGFGQGEGLRVNEVEGRGPVIQDAAHVAERRGFRTDQVTVCLPPLAPCEPSPQLQQAVSSYLERVRA